MKVIAFLNKRIGKVKVKLKIGGYSSYQERYLSSVVWREFCLDLRLRNEGQSGDVVLVSTDKLISNHRCR